MRVSVVICTYAPQMYDHLVEAVESVLDQSHEDIEVVVVVDGAPDVYERVLERYARHEIVRTILNSENRGLSASRNVGIEEATGEVIAFMDDDAIADPHWLEKLVEVYEEMDAIAVGGRMAGEWIGGKPSFLPEEYYWLVGVTHRGFADSGDEVRNTFGSNISFRREVLKDLGGFNERVGLRGSIKVQAEEPELCVRMASIYGQGVVYQPDAVVYHKVFDYRTDIRWLIKRAFWQGFSKRIMQLIGSNADIAEESDFLIDLVRIWVPDRVKQLVRSPTVVEVKQLLALWILTGSVGAGYLYGTILTETRRAGGRLKMR